VPALVRVTVEAPGAEPVTLPEQPFDAGDLRASVPVPAAPTGGPPIGNWKATITADAGAGRTVAVPVDFTVLAPPPPPTSAEAWPAIEGLPSLNLGDAAGHDHRSRPVPLALLFLAATTLAGAVVTVVRELV
jgi:hypothetical protein